MDKNVWLLPFFSTIYILQQNIYRVKAIMNKNSFIENISNEEVNKLPIIRFEGEIVVVDKPEQVGPACEDLLKQKVIGFDSETRPNFKAGRMNKVALLQLSTPTHCYLFRLNRVGLQREMTRVLERASIKKIGADVRDDIRELNQLRKFRSKGFIDLQSIISKWGVAEKSVRKMSAIVLGERVSKAQRLSNWEASTLTPAQQQYAATDAWICAEIYKKLQETEQRPLKSEKEQQRELRKAQKEKREKREKGKKGESRRAKSSKRERGKRPKLSFGIKRSRKKSKSDTENGSNKKE